MAITFERVHPGDLIRSEVFNQIFDQIERIQGELDALGASSGGPVITGTSPAGDVPELTQLQVLGRNFATPANVNQVTLDAVSVTGLLPGSSDTVLKMLVPGGIQGLPKLMTLAVTTSRGSASIPIRVVPGAPQLGGQPQIINVTSGLPAIVAGNTYTFTFRLDGTALTATETFQLVPIFTAANPPGTESSWLTQTSLVGAGGNRVTLSATTPLTVGVQIVVPVAAKSVGLTLRAVSMHNSPASDAESALVPVTVGQQGPNSDPRISLFIAPIGGAAPMKTAEIDGVLGLEVQYASGGPRSVLVPIDARFAVAGTYAFSVAIDNAGPLWTVQQPTPPTVAVSAGDDRTINFTLTLNATGSQAEKRTLTFRAVRQTTDAIGQISAFTSFPIQGYP